MSIAANVAYQGIPVGLTAEGNPYLGESAAPITLVEFSDFLCPFCQRHFQQTYPVLLDKYIRSGQVKLIFRQFPLSSLHPTAPVGAAAALCVAQQSPALFWSIHDELFRRQDEWRHLTNPADYLEELANQDAFWSMHDELFGLVAAWTAQTSLKAAETQVNELATQLNLDSQQFHACLNSRDALESVLRDLQDGQGLIQQTPTFIVLNNDTGTLIKGSRPAAEFITLLRSFIEQADPANQTILEQGGDREVTK